MTWHGIGYLKTIYLKIKSMKKIIIVFLLILPYLLHGQSGEFFPKMPKKYEEPFPGMSTSMSDERSEKVWYVYAAKNNIPVFSDENCQNLKGYEKFFQILVVWQENEKAVRVVKKRGVAPITANYRFTSEAVEAGWVRKEDLILGDRCLSIDKRWVKAILNKTPDNKTLPANMPGFNGKITDTVFNPYFVLKQQKDAWLLSVTDIPHEDLTREDVFWVRLSDIITIGSNQALVPDWDKVIEGQKLYTFSDRSRTGNYDTARAAMKIYKNNSHIGFFLLSDDRKTAKVLNPLAMAIDTQFINLSDARFLRANFLDDHQFTALKDFEKVLSNSPERILLKINLINYFAGRSIDTLNAKVRAMNIAEMLGYTLGIDFSNFSNSETTPVMKINDLTFDSYYRSFKDNDEKLNSEKEVDKFRFYAKMNYFWFPQNLLSLDIMSKITLFEPSKIVVKGGNYREFNVFYIDHSAPAEEKSFEQLNSEIRKLFQRLSLVWEAEGKSNDIGDMMYYSSGFDPVISSGQAGFEMISGQMRISSTIRPDHFFDKLRLENKLLGQIQGVTDKITIHFDVSDSFYQSEMLGRAFFLKEFIERINLILSSGNTQILVYLYFNNPKNVLRQTEIQNYCNKLNTLYPNVKYVVFNVN
jgi:hypothetical protein